MTDRPDPEFPPPPASYFADMFDEAVALLQEGGLDAERAHLEAFRTCLISYFEVRPDWRSHGANPFAEVKRAFGLGRCRACGLHYDIFNPDPVIVAATRQRWANSRPRWAAEENERDA